MAAATRPPRLAGLAARLPARQIEQVFVLTRDEITVRRHTAPNHGGRSPDFASFQLAQIVRASISQDCCGLTHRLPRSPTRVFTEDATHAVLAILAGPGRVAETLSLMHRVRLLERLIRHSVPCAADAVHAYHKYTVDHHSLLALVRQNKSEQDKIYWGRSMERSNTKTSLHLAILLHDVGKGQIEDHSLVESASRVRRLSDSALGTRDPLTDFLFRYHMLMSLMPSAATPPIQVVLGFGGRWGRWRR